MEYLLYISIVVTNVFCNSINLGTVSDPNITSTTEIITTVNPKSVCDVCNCTVDTINCDGLQLGYHFENSLWPVTPLQLVTFEDNTIVHLKPFPNVAINKLILRYNKISKIDDNAFKEVRNLSELDLSHNYITSDVLLPSVFKGQYSPIEWEPLPQLTVLNLSRNKLHTLHQDLFSHVTDVKVLILSGNPLGVIDHATVIALSNLFGLEELYLEYCDLDKLPDHMFHVHKLTLKKLFLSGNRFLTIPTALEDASKLEYLTLNDNSFLALGRTNIFPKLPMLKQLYMCSLPHLTHVGENVFSKLTALEELSLSDCPRLKSIDEDALVLHGNNGAIWPPLKRLDISHNALKYLPANLLLGRWEKMEKLDLTDNDWSCDCENQYLIGTLLPNLGKTLMSEDLGKLFCSAPPEHAGKNLTSLSHRKLRCLDRYGARPERDAAILVGVFIGILLALPLTLTLFVLWRRGYFFCGPQTPASFSRAFYKRASGDDN